MQSGKILVAQHDGTFVIKMVGDVRLTLCTTIDDYFNQMFGAPEFIGVVIDLSDAECIDSTSLGLLAKLAVQAKDSHKLTPEILSPNPNITRLLDSMGFNKVFEIHDDMGEEFIDELGELPLVDSDEQCLRSKIIEAHQVLMSLNEKNRETFLPLMSVLEAS